MIKTIPITNSGILIFNNLSSKCFDNRNQIINSASHTLLNRIENKLTLAVMQWSNSVLSAYWSRDKNEQYYLLEVLIGVFNLTLSIDTLCKFGH